ncbi:MAG: AraC family transcriptional regulator [Clostridiales bacterium]|uniref:hypothetical protein n=1 Tax=Flavonifractor porci TaxID=3133422 RepID=UPI0030AB4D86|nr:AraC family transcriptional regulator [Clostridiales bacterium]
MARKTRLAAACGAALLVFALLFSVFFTVAEAEHDCGGEHCAICHQIQACQELLEQFSSAHTASAAAAVLCFFMLFLVLSTQNIVVASSLVLWKVKLLN